MTSGKNHIWQSIRAIVIAMCFLSAGATKVKSWAPSRHFSRLGSPSIPRPEHPKPQFRRQAWINLNGQWDLAMDPNVVGIKQNWQDNPSRFKGFPKREKMRLGTPNRKITVPFCVESRLSGIGYTDFIKAVWYRRTFSLPL
ncbi:MAG: hypothetical protein ACE5NM_08010, partial [Sedimentisphaerales bacterium]